VQVANLMPWVMLSDVIDEDELRHKRRREGLLSAFFVFINKVAVGLTLALSGFILDAGGYDNSSGQEPEPTPELSRTMRLLCGVLPLVCAALMAPLLYLYPMTHTRQLEVNRRVVAQRAKDAAGAPAVAATDAAGARLESSEGAPLLAPGSEDDARVRFGAGAAPVAAYSSTDLLPSVSDVSFGRGNAL
jgi:hypothetical protein